MKNLTERQKSILEELVVNKIADLDDKKFEAKVDGNIGAEDYFNAYQVELSELHNSILH